MTRPNLGRILAALQRGFDVTLYGSFPGRAGCFYVSGVRAAASTPAPGYEMWRIIDNGGEYDVERVNDMESRRSVPYETHGGRLVHEDAILMNIVAVLRGIEMNFDPHFMARGDDIVSTIIEPAPPRFVSLEGGKPT